MDNIQRKMAELASEVERNLKIDKHKQFLFEIFLKSRYPAIAKQKAKPLNKLCTLLPDYIWAKNYIPSYILFADFAVWLDNEVVNEAINTATYTERTGPK